MTLANPPLIGRTVLAQMMLLSALLAGTVHAAPETASSSTTISPASTNQVSKNQVSTNQVSKNQASISPATAQQVPGYYRVKLGNFQVTALYDGYVKLAPDLFNGLKPQQITQLLQQKFVDGSDGIQTAVNAFLIDTGQQLILVDSGAAKCFGDTLGSIEDNLQAAGYRPEQINAVLLTHLHPDHVCGITHQADGKKAFENATVYVNQAEADFWLDSKNLSKYSKAKQEKFKGAFDLVANVLKPYQASQQYKTYAIGSTIVEGIEVIQTPGHTAGHASYQVSSADQQLIILGDVVHSHAIQFQQPQVSVNFDLDEKQAVASRLKVFTQAAKSGTLVAGAHLPFPGLGHIRQTAKQQFEWVPVEYSPLPLPTSP